MISPVKIYSVLGNPNSLIPLGIKDSSSCLGLTASSYITGKKEEATDRFIDEIGTEAIWLGGIPLFKKIIDKTVFKIAKFDSKYDIRNLQDNDIFEKTKKYAPTDNIKNNIDKISKNKKLYKGLNVVKIVSSIGLAFLSYNVLTNFKQKYTENKIEKKLREEAKNAYNKNNNANLYIKSNNNSVFTSMKKNTITSFKGGVTDFILNPVKNMYVLDGGITAQRLAKSRDKQEFVGYAIKEGGFLFFMYYAGQKIQTIFENIVNKKHNKSINLDIRVLEDDNFKNSFKTGEIEKSLKSFSTKSSSTNADLYDFIINNPENDVVKVSKKSDIIQNYKTRKKGILGIFKSKIDSGKIDTRKYIPLEDIKKTGSNIQSLYNQYLASGENIDVFFNKVKKLKRKSIKLNIAVSSIALGVVIPGIMLAKRLLNGDKEFATKTRIKMKLAKEHQYN